MKAPDSEVFLFPEALGELRRSTFEEVGLPWGLGILYGIGMSQGLLDAYRLNRGFAGEAPGLPQLAERAYPIVFQPDAGGLGETFTGQLADSVEARVHRAHFPEARDPICFVSAGYAAGWYSALLGRFQLVREIECRGCGDARCRFEARPADAWLDEDDLWARELLPFVDYQQLRDRALERLAEEEGGKDDAVPGGLMGCFDSMSPAVHVWGPVMVLPYSGLEDSAAAIEAIEEDIGPGQIQVTVIDVTGVRFDEVEAAGLVRLLDCLEAHGIEPLVAGISDEMRARHLPRELSLRLPLACADLAEGVARAFQICGPPPASA